MRNHNKSFRFLLFIGFLIIMSGLVNAITTQNQSAYYKSDVNNSFPDSHNGFDGTINSAIFTLTGQINGAYEYSGTSQYINLGNQDAFNIDPTDKITVCSWVYKDSLTNEQAIMSKITGSPYKGWSFNIRATTGAPSFLLSDTFATSKLNRYSSGTAITANTWHHVCFSYNGTSASSGIKLYVDGSEVSGYTDSNTGIISTTSNSVDSYIGGRQDGVQYWDGKLDEIAIFNKVLNSTEISELYNSGNGLQYPYNNVTLDFFKVFAKSFWDNSTLNNFSVYIDETTTPINNGTKYTNGSTDYTNYPTNSKGIYFESVCPSSSNNAGYIPNKCLDFDNVLIWDNSTQIGCYGQGEHVVLNNVCLGASSITLWELKEYNTTNGTVTTDILRNDTTSYIVLVKTNDRFEQLFENYNVSTNLVASLKQSQITIFVTDLFTNDSYSNFTVKSGATTYCTTSGNNCTFFPDAGNYTVIITDNTGEDTFHTTSNTFEVLALDNKSVIVKAHPHELFVYARTINNGTINNFSATITSLNFTDVRTLNTTTGVINFDVTHSDYSVVVDAQGYALQNNTFNITIGTGQQNYTRYVYLYTTNSVNITFYKSSDGTILDDANISVSFLGARAFNTSTSNGTLYVDLLNPSEYTIIYTAPGYRVGSYIFTLTNRSHNSINLYLDQQNATSLALITVLDKFSKDPVKGADVTIQRYINNAWQTEQIIKTDFNGQSEAWFVVSTEFYNFLVSKDGITYFGIINSNENKKVIYAEDISNGIIIEVDTNPNVVISKYQSTYSVSHTLNFYNLSNSSGRFIFYWDDNDNLNRLGELKVKLGNNINCTQSSTGETGTLICNVNISDATVRTTFFASAYLDGSLVDTKIGVLGVNQSLNINWGTTGWIITIFLVIIGFSLFLSTPKVAIVFGTIIFALAIGFNLVFDKTGISVIISIIFLAGLLVRIPRKEGE